MEPQQKNRRPFREGSLIRLDHLAFSHSDPEVLSMTGATGTVTKVTDILIWGSWGPLAILPEVDTFTVLEY